MEIHIYSHDNGHSTNNTGTYIPLGDPETVDFTLASSTNTVIIEYAASLFIPESNTGDQGSNVILIDGVEILTTRSEAGLFVVDIRQELETGTRHVVQNMPAGPHTVAVNHKTEKGTPIVWRRRLLKVTVLP